MRPALWILPVLMLAACKKEKDGETDTAPVDLTLNGALAKGPFVLGSSVDVAVAMPGAMRTGIVENSPFNSEEAKKQLQAAAGAPGLVLSPDQAARKILSAIVRGRRRITVGADAWVLDKCYRIAPVTTSRLLHRATRSMRARLQT